MAEESKQFWGNTWSQSVDHKKDAKWLQNLPSEVNVKKQEKIDIAKLEVTMSRLSPGVLVKEF